MRFSVYGAPVDDWIMIVLLTSFSRIVSMLLVPWRVGAIPGKWVWNIRAQLCCIASGE